MRNVYWFGAFLGLSLVVPASAFGEGYPGVQQRGSWGRTAIGVLGDDRTGAALNTASGLAGRTPAGTWAGRAGAASTAADFTGAVVLPLVDGDPVRAADGAALTGTKAAAGWGASEAATAVLGTGAVGVVGAGVAGYAAQQGVKAWHDDFIHPYGRPRNVDTHGANTPGANRVVHLPGHRHQTPRVGPWSDPYPYGNRASHYGRAHAGHSGDDRGQRVISIDATQPGTVRWTDSNDRPPPGFREQSPAVIHLDGTRRPSGNLLRTTDGRYPGASHPPRSRQTSGSGLPSGSSHQWTIERID